MLKIIYYTIFISMKVIIENNEFNVKICMTSESIRNGMMGKRFNDEFNGMFFLMPHKGEQSFWMMNCIIPLDIIMIDGSIITEVHSNCEPCNDEHECQSYKGYGNRVLEIAGGTAEKLNIKKGDQVSFSLF